MIDGMSDYIIKSLIRLEILKQEQYSDYDYYLRLSLHFVLSNTLLIFTCSLFDAGIEAFMIACVYSWTREYLGSVWHSITLRNCTIISVLMTIPFAYISVNIHVSNLIIFVLISFLLCYNQIPVKRNEDDEQLIGDLQDYILAYNIVILGCLLTYILKMYTMTNAILCGLILVNITNNKYVITMLEYIDQKLNRIFSK